MRIIPIPCLKDNFAYLLICETTGLLGIVDPSEAGPVLKALEPLKLQPVAILNTHHHWDHTGGNSELLMRYPDLKVYGYSSDRGRIQGQTEFLEDGDQFQIGGMTGRALFNPGHTLGAVSYFFEDSLFTGDTLFAAGCGRTFEGSAEQMYDSLNQVIGGLSDETQLYFGHEYTLNNLAFAQAVEPHNRAIQKRLKEVQGLRAKQSWTTPSNLALERQTNPFLRCEQGDVHKAVASREPGVDLSNGAEVFRVLRAWKDQF